MLSSNFWPLPPLPPPACRLQGRLLALPSILCLLNLQCLLCLPSPRGDQFCCCPVHVHHLCSAARTSRSRLPAPSAQHMIAGALAGIGEHVAMYPVDTVKTRMQALAHPGQQVGRSTGRRRRRSAGRWKDGCCCAERQGPCVSAPG